MKIGSSHSKPLCPCCHGSELYQAGKLPSSCQFAGRTLDVEIPGGWLFRCRQCHLAFRYPLQAIVKSGALYDNSATSTWTADSVRNDHGLIVKYLKASLPSGGAVLDFGCYTGELLKQLGTSYDRFGIEVNSAAAKLASKELGHEVSPTVNELPQGLLFDAIVIADVIEHMPNPLNLLQKLRCFLKPSGTMIITTGDAQNRWWTYFGSSWWYCFYPEHIAFASKAWFDYISTHYNFSLIHHEYFRYRDTGIARRTTDGIQAGLYGILPTAYLKIVNTVRRLSGRGTVSSVPGAGVSRDHILAILSNKTKHDAQEI